MAIIIKKLDKWLCSKCFVIQPGLREQCVFCNSIFSNYEEEKLKEWEANNNDTMRNSNPH